ncbi:DNA alkylation repair enzyme [Desulfovibrio sp. X2]|uniref:DNA alkylation repair protein n=1 Tax=Desulfovibrio sp. X2 TaxID=941449 RepID=UPI000358E3C6|nr:DNA alkylation repair protein [Desulfovibrio sp. X2]EPR43896.1 DNA alkylation repair enzyme [Desulfovibrio sp. X2]
MTRAEEIVARLRGLSNQTTKTIRTKLGMSTDHAACVPMRVVRGLAMQIHRDHALALELWESGLYEARVLATIIADPARVSDPMMEKWAAESDSWDLTDQCCQNLFWRTHYAWTKAEEWTDRPEELVKRAAFALMAVLSLKQRHADEAQFLSFLPLIRREATDERRHVRSAVSWALRNIGRVSPAVRAEAEKLAEELAGREEKSAKVIGRQAQKAFKKLAPRGS